MLFRRNNPQQNANKEYYCNAHHHLIEFIPFNPQNSPSRRIFGIVILVSRFRMTVVLVNHYLKQIT